MKFECSYQNGKPYDWEKYTKNPFTRSFKHWMCLTSVQNDKVLIEEFKNLIDLEKYNNLSYLEGDSDMKKLNWLKRKIDWLDPFIDYEDELLTEEDKQNLVFPESENDYHRTSYSSYNSYSAMAPRFTFWNNPFRRR